MEKVNNNSRFFFEKQQKVFLIKTKRLRKRCRLHSHFLLVDEVTSKVFEERGWPFMDCPEGGMCYSNTYSFCEGYVAWNSGA